MSMFKKEGESSLDYQWSLLEMYKRSGQSFSAKVIDINKDELVVDISGIKGRVPLSSLVTILDSEKDLSIHKKERMQAWQLEQMKDQEIQLKVVEVERSRNHLLLSIHNGRERRYLLGSGRKEFLQKLQPGDVRQGIIISLIGPSILVDLGGVHGVVHERDFFHNNPDQAGEMIQIGQTIEALVLDIDGEVVSLSMKYLSRHDDFSQEWRVGDIRQGTVIALPHIGAFVDVQGTLGLISADLLTETYSTYINQFKDLLYNGQKVLVKIVGVSKEKRWASLSIVQASAE